MVWMALIAGAATFASLSAAAGAARRRCSDIGTAALRSLGASGMFALAVVSAGDGAWPAATVAALCGVTLTCDVRAVLARLLARVRSQSATVTPFQNAT